MLNVATRLVTTGKVERSAAQQRNGFRLTLSEIPRCDITVTLLTFGCVAEQHMGEFVKPGLVRQGVQRVESDDPVPGVAHAVAIDCVELDFVDIECDQGLLSVSLRDTRLGQLVAFGLAQDEPLRAIHEPHESSSTTVCTVGVSIGLLLAL